MVLSSPEFTDSSAFPVPRKSYARLPQILDVPNLIKVQLDSFQRFQESGLKQLLEEDQKVMAEPNRPRSKS